ncbi:polysaccharide biosynthesis protein [Salinisphaera hydrothermalis EPR70]
MFVTVSNAVARARGNTVVSNALALISVQGANYLLPLISLPYLVNMLGASAYGSLAFAQSLSFFLGIIVTFGLDIYLTKEVSENRDDKLHVAALTASAIAAKLCFSMLGAMLLVAFSFATQDLGGLKYWLLAYIAVIGGAFRPGWVFQGYERMRPLAVIDIGSRALGVVAMLVTVRSAADLWKALLCFSLPPVCAGAFALYYQRRVFSIPFATPKFSLAVREVKESWDLFLASAGSTLLVQLNVVILGLIVSPAALGTYAACEKLIRAACGLNAPITQAAFPHATSLRIRDESKFEGFFTRISIVQPLLMLPVSLFVFFGSEFLTRDVLGLAAQPASIMLKVMALMPISSALSDVFGIIGLVGSDGKKLYSRIFFIIGFLNVASVSAFSYFFGAMGAAISLACIEGMLASSLIVAVLGRRRLYRHGLVS